MKAYHTSQLSTLSSQLSSCPQKAAELQVQGSNAAELLVQSSKFRAPTNSPEGGELSYLSSRQANYALCIMNYALLLYVVDVV